MIGRIVGLAVATLVLGVAPARASDGVINAFQSGNSLFELCTSPESDAVHYSKEAACRAYISGVIDGLVLQSVVDENRVYCLPGNVTQGQMQDLVTKYLRDHPEERHKIASLVIAMAIRATFSC